MAKIAILTNFMDFNPGYSLTGIVKDQVIMLLRNGHKVDLFVNSQYNMKSGVPVSEEEITKFGGDTKNYQMIQKIPFQNLTDYRLASPKLPNVKGWYHWVHSMPSALRDWWIIKQYGPKHKIVYPNYTDRIQAAEQYRGTVSDVCVVPHIKDIRSWFDFHPDTCRFIDKYPSVLSADVVQLLPASVDRLESKRVREVCKIMSGIKSQGRSVCLIIANQWATGRQQKQDVDKYRMQAVRDGLVDQKELIFTSDFESPKFDVGIPQRMIRELFLCSNLFIFPTREESFGLVVPEAALSGCFLVLNRSLQMQREVSGNEALFFDFGSCHNEHTVENERYWSDIGFIVSGRMKENEAIKSKTFARQTYNMDNLYNAFYMPMMAEARYER